MNSSDVGLLMSGLSVALACLANIERGMGMRPSVYAPTFVSAAVLLVVAALKIVAP